MVKNSALFTGPEALFAVMSWGDLPPHVVLAAPAVVELSLTHSPASRRLGNFRLEISALSKGRRAGRLMHGSVEEIAIFTGPVRR
jgi:hypothetical protein